MVNGIKVVVVLPAYNAAQTLEKTYSEIPPGIADEVVLVDDASSDGTAALARKLGIRHIIQHDRNKGYGGNQKSCYDKAMELDGGIIVMLHPDYQYTPKLIPVMVHIIASGVYPVVLGSRILGNGALKGNMPYYKYVANRFLTLVQNILIGQKLSEYHTGYRAFSREVLATIRYEDNSDDYVFDNQMLSQIVYAGFDIAEVTCPTKYFREASSINFSRSIVYGLGVVKTSLLHFLQRTGIANFKMYEAKRKHKSEESSSAI